jgi:hypothetical protein
MQLIDYLIREKLTFTAFAALVGSKHARTVERYAKGDQIPGREMMVRIVDVTAGEVTANDFFGIVGRPAANLPAADNHTADNDPISVSHGVAVESETIGRSSRKSALSTAGAFRG